MKEKLVEYDVGLKEDLIYGLKNLCAIENHCKSSYYKNKDNKFLEMNKLIREMRSRWLEKIVKKSNDETWCISKHLLNSIMSMEEVANRLNSTPEGLQAEEDANLLIGLFLLLNDIGGSK